MPGRLTYLLGNEIMKRINHFAIKREISVFLVTTVILSLVYFFFLRDRDKSVNGKALNDSVDKQGLSAYHKREVNYTIKKHSRKIQDCYNEFLDSKPKITEGKIHFDWQIQPEGNVETPEVITSDFQSKEFENCIQAEISSWKFPPPPTSNRNTYAEFTFAFRKQENLPKASDFAPQIINTPNGKKD